MTDLITNLWITNGIRISCKRKRNFYLLTRNNNDIKQYHKLHCKILNTMIKEAERSNQTEPIVNSDNKEKSWNIIKFEAGTRVNNDDIKLFSKEGDKINNCKIISESFSNYFLTN